MLLLVLVLQSIHTVATQASVGLDSGNVAPTVSATGKARCVSGLATVTFNAKATLFDLSESLNQYQVTEVLQELFEVNSTFVSSHTTGAINVTGPYSISGVLCYPTEPANRTRTVQILTHGLGLDKSYWDIAPGYSYVDAAAEAGYATFAYDRLGVGDSDHPDPINVVQSTVHVEVLHTLIESLTNGGLLGESRFEDVVCIGHSYGSVLQIGHDAKYPNDCEAVVLTGVGANFDYLPTALLVNNPTIANTVRVSYAHLQDGYLVTPTAVAFQLPFFRYPYFETKVFELQLANGGTYSLSDELTAAAVLAPAASYTGPVDVVLGQYDYVFCMGDCTKQGDPAGDLIKAFYPAASADKSSTFVVPDCGHCINDHYAASEAFKHISQFVKTAGL